MATYGFFNAVVEGGEPDRTYDADDINQIFSGMISEGVFKSYLNALKVEANTEGLAVTVESGKAIIKDHWFINKEKITMYLSPAHSAMNRIDNIVLRFDIKNRKIALGYSVGQASRTPTAPILRKTAEMYEIKLAEVYVSNGATTLTDSDITDSRTFCKGMVDAANLQYRRYDYTLTEQDGMLSLDIPETMKYTVESNLLVYVNGFLAPLNSYDISVNSGTGNYYIAFKSKITYPANISLILMD